ncbi:MAG: hypothetical protein WCG80_03755 [Spirochaetales bacterium]
MKWLGWALACLLLSATSVGGQTSLGEQTPGPQTSADLLLLGQQAERAENYQQAIADYQRAAELDPKSPEPPRALALLYASQNLQRLALPAWEAVLAKTPDDRDSWIEVAQTHGYLNEDHEAVVVYEEALRRFPADLDLAQALAWMLFKTEDFQRGITLLESMLKSQATTAGVEMILGTLYSSQFSEAQARVHYLQSIALTTGNSLTEKVFRSIAWYNLSLLDKDFYHFEASRDDLKQSILQQERASNHLAMGELEQEALQEKAARQSYTKALETDDTPLSLFDLAKLEQLFGHLNDAKSRATEVANFRDETWIFNFGVTKEKFLRDQEELAADIHHAAWLLLDFQARTTVWDWFVWAWNKTSEGLQWYYHDQNWKNLLVKTGNTSLQVRNSPEAWVNLTLAHRDLPGLGLKYLSLSRQHELPRNPLSQPSYQLEEGLLAGDEKLLERALKQLQTPGENADRARGLAKLVELRRGRGAEVAARQALSDLFAIGAGLMPAQGLALPVRSLWFGADATQLEQWRRAESDYASQSHWDISGASRPGVVYDLDIQVFSKDSRQLFWTLRDATGAPKKSGRVEYDPQTKMEALASILLQVHTSD